MTSAPAVRPLTRPRLRAAAVDEALVALIGLVIYTMVVQRGVAALLALPLSRLVEPAARALGVGLTEATVWAVAALVWTIVRLVYRVLGAGGPSGQTPGKRWAGIRVLGRAGKPPGYRRAVVRETVLHVEILTVVGVVAALLPRPWHDVAGGTHVAVQ